MVYRTFRWFELVGTLLGCCLLLFIIAPLVGMVLATDQEQLGSAVRDSEVVASIKLTLRAAFLATAVSAVAGVPLAYFLARKRFRGRAILLAIVDLPIIIPHTAAGIALLGVIGRDSMVGRVFGGSLIGTEAGISVSFWMLPVLAICLSSFLL